MGEMSHVVQKLRLEYCPPLDDAVFLAIQADYDLSNGDDLRDFVDTLETLKQSTLEEENVDFDPSGTGGAGPHGIDSSLESRSIPDESSVSNGVTSITTGLSELNWDSNTAVGSNLEELSVHAKTEWLRETFPDISAYTVSSVLKQCAGRVDRAVDELMNVSFLEREENPEHPGQSLIPKGVDGFLGHEAARGRKGRKKRKTGTNESSRTTSPSPALADLSTYKKNIWSEMSANIEFICSRTAIPDYMVKSSLHAHGASLSATVRAFAVKHAVTVQTLAELDPHTLMEVADLKAEFAGVPESHIYGLLTISRNTPDAARELLTAMISSPTPYPPGKVDGLVTYTPTRVVAETERETGQANSPWAHSDVSRLTAEAARQGAAANGSYQKAAAAFKRGKSDQLMGGAAAYYADVGREQVQAARRAHAAAADALVYQQSSSTVLDLHGVSVADAVRITQDAVSTWWDRLGDVKHAPGGGGPARDGYRIVTGVGRHSKDGTPRIGPAVSRMLIREGWKIGVEQGEIYVYGKPRR